MKRIKLLFICTLLMGVLTKCDTKPENENLASIFGVIIDYETGEPITNASISLSTRGQTQISGTDGRYEFLNLDSEQYTVTVQKANYQTNRKTVTTINGKKTEANIPLTKNIDDNNPNENNDNPNRESVKLPVGNLMVQKTDVGVGNWIMMNSKCEESAVDGYDDWRMPTIDELKILYNVYYENNIIGEFITNGSYRYYWSSSSGEHSHWYLDFRSGMSQNSTGSDTHLLNCRCVRTLP